MQVIPCIQTLAHVNALFHWPVYREIHDAADILLTGDERTYELVEGMFRTLRECLRTNVVNIGMDEADLLGLGKYLTLHGYRDRFGILMEHLRRVSEMAKKYDFELLMWGDMFFRLAGGDYFTNFNQNPELGEIPEEIKQLVPKHRRAQRHQARLVVCGRPVDVDGLCTAQCVQHCHHARSDAGLPRKGR